MTRALKQFRSNLFKDLSGFEIEENRFCVPALLLDQKIQLLNRFSKLNKLVFKCGPQICECKDRQSRTPMRRHCPKRAGSAKGSAIPGR